MSTTLRQGDSVNLSTGKITHNDHRTATINVPSGVNAHLRRNNLRALALALASN